VSHPPSGEDGVLDLHPVGWKAAHRIRGSAVTHQLTLEVPEEVYRPLLERARATGQTVEDVARACLADSVQKAAPGSPLRKWAGSWASNVPDAGVRHDEYLGRALHDELNEPGRD
jgi:hypothetical protein